MCDFFFCSCKNGRDGVFGRAVARRRRRPEIASELADSENDQDSDAISGGRDRFFGFPRISKAEILKCNLFSASFEIGLRQNNAR